MADTPTQPQLPQLTISNVLGIVQRVLAEVNAYLSQDPRAVDRNVVMGRLEEAAQWVAQLPSLPGATPPVANGNQQPDKAQARKN